LGNTRHFVEEFTKMARESLTKKKIYLLTKYIKSVLWEVAVRLYYFIGCMVPKG